MKKLVVLLGILTSFAFVSSVFAAFFDPNYDVRTIKTEHFYIHYPREIAPIALDLKDLVETVHEKISTKLKWKPWGRTHVLIVDKTDSANGLATVIPANYLLLYVSPPDADSSLDHYKNYLELLFTHEYTHIVHIDQHYRVADPFHWVLGKIVAPNGLTPSWMREGIAAWNETTETGRGRGNGTYAEMMIRTSILEDKFPKIDQIAGLGNKFPGADSAYMYGVKFFMWLQDKYGAEKIQKYSEKYASGLLLFSLNGKAKNVFGKSFYQLWQDWQVELKDKYFPLRDQLTQKGLTVLDNVEVGEDQYRAPVAHPKGGYAYVDVSLDESSRVVIKNPGSEPQSIKRAAQGQMSFSKDGGSFLAYSAQAGVQKYHIFNEVYVYDLAKQKIRRLAEKGHEKESLRASDPDFAPIEGGKRWLVMVRGNLATDNLYVYDIATHKGYYLTDAPKYTQFASPRFSPDGQHIVVSRRDHNGNRDLVLYSKTGQEIRKLTNDEFTENNPGWFNNNSIYFDSDRSGINNIFKIDINGENLTQLSNVLTGVYRPQLTSDGKSFLVEAFNSTGFSIKKMKVASTGYALENKATATSISAAQLQALPYTIASTSSVSNQRVNAGFDALPEGVDTDTVIDSENDQTENSVMPGFYFSGLNTELINAEDSPSPENSPGPEEVVKTPEDKKTETEPEKEVASNYAKLLDSNKGPQKSYPDIPGSTKYNAFPQLLVPRYIVPTFATLDNSLLFGVATGRFDPLYRHNWSAAVNYRTDANFAGASFNYAYTRYKPTFYVGANRYALNWGHLFSATQDFFEQRVGGYIGASFPLNHQLFGINYFFENRDNLSTIPAGFSLPTLDRYAGLRLNYIYSRYKQFSDSISQENGPLLKIGLDWTNSLLGSSQNNEQVVLTGDMRYYFEMPWSDHHVFALRAAAGWVWGDQEFRGSFRFGGPFGEGVLGGYSSRLFPFRGLPGVTFADDRVMLMSAEYRIPIVDVERGLGTWPVFMKQMHLGIFSDAGDSWARNGKANVGFFDDFFVSTGAELRSDLMLGYGLPVTARLGYAIILTNRDQIAGLQDSTFGMDVKNGTFYFQFGTSF